MVHADGFRIREVVGTALSRLCPPYGTEGVANILVSRQSAPS